MNRKHGYNGLKVVALKMAKAFGELKSRDLALVEGITAMASSMQLLSYYRNGLLERERVSGAYVYVLTEKGRERLSFLEK